MCTQDLYLRVNAALLSLRRASGAHQRPLNTEILNVETADTEGSSIRVGFANLAPALIFRMETTNGCGVA